MLGTRGIDRGVHACWSVGFLAVSTCPSSGAPTEAPPKGAFDMATDGFDLRISLQRLLVWLILTIVPLSIFGLYITARSDKALELAVGSHFKMIADSKAGQIGQFVNDLVVEMGALASAPAVREEAAVADAANRGAGESSAG